MHKTSTTNTSAGERPLPSQRGAGSADQTHVKDAELGPAGGAWHAAGQPGFRPVLVLAAGEPAAQTGQAPHGSAEALPALRAAVITWVTRWPMGHFSGTPFSGMLLFICRKNSCTNLLHSRA